MNCRKKVGFWATILNYIFKESEIMAGIEEIKDSVGEVSLTIDKIDLKLDEVKAYIDSLKGSVVTQEQLDELAALVDSAKSQSVAVLGEAEGLAPVEAPPVEPVE